MFFISPDCSLSILEIALNFLLKYSCWLLAVAIFTFYFAMTEGRSVTFCKKMFFVKIKRKFHFYFLRDVIVATQLSDLISL